MARLTLEQYIEKARKVHGDRYIYDKVVYKNPKTPIIVACPIHGDFSLMPYEHLSGRGCPKCSAKQKVTNEEFIRRAKAAHGDRYIYDKVDYKNQKTPVEIICPIHGSFWQKIQNHIVNHQGCPQCAKLRIQEHARSLAKTTEQFIKEAREVHGDKYVYSKVDYKNNATKVEIGCPIHGSFWQTPKDHLSGQGCPQCAGNIKYTQKEFVERAREVHGDKYIYADAIYNGANNEISVMCPIHGPFATTPYRHINMENGCPRCRDSKGEKIVGKILESKNVEYIPQKTFDWLKYDQPQRLDFYLPKQNIAIEYQGEQHFKPVSTFGGETGYELCKLRDQNKLTP